MEDLKDILKAQKDYLADLKNRQKYVTQEFQDYGYRLAMKLEVPKKRVSLYIKLAKDKPRALLEQAYSFAIDYPKAKNKEKLFMWKLRELSAEYKEKKEKEKEEAQPSLLDIAEKKDA